MHNQPGNISPNPFSHPTEQTHDSESFEYGGFWARLLAYLLDGLVMLPLAGMILYTMTLTRLANLYFFLPNLLIGIFFHIWLVKKYGGTPGKLIMKLRIVRSDGTPVGYKEAFLRHSVTLVLTTIVAFAGVLAALNIPDQAYFSAGWRQKLTLLNQYAPDWFGIMNTLLNIWIWSEFLVMMTNRKRRALHDFMAGTLVIVKP